MIWVLKSLLSLASSIAKYLQQKQLIDVGEAKAIARNLDATLEKIRKADAARHSANDNGMHGDPRNRD